MHPFPITVGWQRTENEGNIIKYQGSITKVNWWRGSRKKNSKPHINFAKKRERQDRDPIKTDPKNSKPSLSAVLYTNIRQQKKCFFNTHLNV